jgi:hypothetical protein
MERGEKRFEKRPNSIIYPEVVEKAAGMRVPPVRKVCHVTSVTVGRLNMFSHF